MPALEDVKAALVKLENGQELYNVVADSIASAQNDRKSEVQTLKSQTEVFSSVLKELGFEVGKTNPQEFVSSVKAKLSTGEQTMQKLTSEQQRIEELSKGLSEFRSKYETAESNRKSQLAKELLSKAMTGRIYGSTAYANELIRNGEVVLSDDEKSLVWKNAESFDKGLSYFFDSHKSDLINSQNGGSGAGDRSSGANAKTMSRAEFDKLDPEARKTFLLKDGGEIV